MRARERARQLAVDAVRRPTGRRSLGPGTRAFRRQHVQESAGSAGTTGESGRRSETSDDLLKAVFDSPRAWERSYAAYASYRDHGGRTRDLNEAFLAALLVIRDVCRSRDRALVGAAAWAMFRALQDRRFTTGDVSRFRTFLRQIARGAVAHEREAAGRFLLVDQVAPEICWDGMGVTGHLHDVNDVERKLVVEKIPILVVRDVVKRLRFADEDREACLYVLQQLVAGHDVLPRGLTPLFELPEYRLRFLVDYVSVRCRIALRKIRDELRAAAGENLGWMGAISITAWLYGGSDDE